MRFDYREVLLGLGPTGIIGLAGLPFVVLTKKKGGYFSVLWLMATILLVFAFDIVAFSHPYRFTQIDIHLPLAIITVLVFSSFSSLFPKIKHMVFNVLVFVLLLISALAWSVSLKAQKMFVDAKIAAGFPLIPQLPYVVYPARSVMETIFWLKENTQPSDVVLAAETIGSMIPAYSGNTVYLGHGSQTVYFEAKMERMKSFYSRLMTNLQMKEFLKENRINYVFYGPEEASFGKSPKDYSFLNRVYSNNLVEIYKVNLSEK